MGALDNIKFAVFDAKKFPEQTKEVSGRSPYWDKTTEGPSYIKPENRQKPLVSNGKLDEKFGKYAEDLTPLLGTTFSVDVKISEILKDDDLIHDLALKISQRGVVVFKKQEDLTVDQQKELVQKLGLAGGKPKANGLHIHPTAPAGGVIGPDGLIDPEVSFISTRVFNKYATVNKDYLAAPTATTWHSDITFEPSGADYSSLRLVELPPNGGDTFWANGYALYEKLSPSLRAYLETLTGTFSQPKFGQFGAASNFKLYSSERGSPENVGDELIAIHPIVRTNPVTGWKSLFAVGEHFTSINDVTPQESKLLKEFIWNLLAQSHELQVRHKWDAQDVAIWDNRNTYHAINKDISFYDNVLRTGIRTVGVGERPFFDPESITQTEALKGAAKAKEAAKEEKEASKEEAKA